MRGDGALPVGTLLAQRAWEGLAASCLPTPRHRPLHNMMPWHGYFGPMVPPATWQRRVARTATTTTTSLALSCHLQHTQPSTDAAVWQFAIQLAMAAFQQQKQPPDSNCKVVASTDVVTTTTTTTKRPLVPAATENKPCYSLLACSSQATDVTRGDAHKSSLSPTHSPRANHRKPPRILHKNSKVTFLDSTTREQVDEPIMSDPNHLHGTRPPVHDDDDNNAQKKSRKRNRKDKSSKEKKKARKERKKAKKRKRREEEQANDAASSHPKTEDHRRDQSTWEFGRKLVNDGVKASMVGPKKISSVSLEDQLRMAKRNFKKAKAKNTDNEVPSTRLPRGTKTPSRFSQAATKRSSNFLARAFGRETSSSSGAARILHPGQQVPTNPTTAQNAAVAVTQQQEPMGQGRPYPQSDLKHPRNNQGLSGRNDETLPSMLMPSKQRRPPLVDLTQPTKTPGLRGGALLPKKSASNNKPLSETHVLTQKSKAPGNLENGAAMFPRTSASRQQQHPSQGRPQVLDLTQTQPAAGRPDGWGARRHSSPQSLHQHNTSGALPPSQYGWPSQQTSFSNPGNLTGQPRHVSGPLVVSNLPEDASQLPPVQLICSENFLEMWGDIVATLSSGKWQKQAASSDIPQPAVFGGRKIQLLDTPLVDGCGIDIELPNRGGALAFSASALEDFSSAKESLVNLAQLAAIGRYKDVFVFICYDITPTDVILRHVSQLQNAVVSHQGQPSTKFYFKTASEASLPSCLAETILTRHRLSSTSSVSEAVADEQLRAWAQFLMQLVPTLSAHGAIQCIQLVKRFARPGQPTFGALLQSQEMRHKVLMHVASSNASEIHPFAMHQLSLALEAEQ